MTEKMSASEALALIDALANFYGGAWAEARNVLTALIAEQDALRSACLLAKSDIDYVISAHPEITGRMVRAEAIAAINDALALSEPAP